MPSPKSTKAAGGSLPRRLGSALARTISRSSVTSSYSDSSSSGSGSGSNSSRTSSDEEARVETPKPAGDAPNPHPIPPIVHRVGSSAPSRRSSSESLSVARTWNTLGTSLGLLSLSPKLDEFEEEEKEREKAERAEQRRRAKQEKAVAKQISEFHTTIQGAVFVGTVRHTSHAMERDTGGIKLFVDTLKPKDPPAKHSKKSIHFANFQAYYNDPEQHAPLQCFFDVFMKTAPPVDSRVTFIVKPTGENGNYVAIACNLAKEKEVE